MTVNEKVDILYQRANGKRFFNPLYIPMFLRWRVVCNDWQSVATKANLKKWINSKSLLSFKTYCLFHGLTDRRTRSNSAANRFDAKYLWIGEFVLGSFFAYGLGFPVPINFIVGLLFVAIELFYDGFIRNPILCIICSITTVGIVGAELAHLLGVA